MFSKATVKRRRSGLFLSSAVPARSLYSIFLFVSVPGASGDCFLFSVSCARKILKFASPRFFCVSYSTVSDTVRGGGDSSSPLLDVELLLCIDVLLQVFAVLFARFHSIPRTKSAPTNLTINGEK